VVIVCRPVICKQAKFYLKKCYKKPHKKPIQMVFDGKVAAVCRLNYIHISLHRQNIVVTQGR